MAQRLPDEVILKVRLRKAADSKAFLEALEKGKIAADAVEMVAVLGDKTVAFCNQRCRFAVKGVRAQPVLAYLTVSLLNLTRCRVKGCMPCKGKTRPSLTWGG